MNNINVGVSEKRFVLMCDEILMAALTSMIPALRYLEVEGMNIDSIKTHQLMVTPVAQMPVAALPVEDVIKEAPPQE